MVTNKRWLPLDIAISLVRGRAQVYYARDLGIARQIAADDVD